MTGARRGLSMKDRGEVKSSGKEVAVQDHLSRSKKEILTDARGKEGDDAVPSRSRA